MAQESANDFWNWVRIGILVVMLIPVKIYRGIKFLFE